MHPAHCGVQSCRKAMQLMRAKHFLNAVQRAGEHRRVLAAWRFFLSKINKFIDMYNKRTWLNKEVSSSTGNVVAFDSNEEYEGKPFRNIFLSVSDCHNSVRLHKKDDESISDFIDKMRLLNLEISNFIIHLENTQMENTKQNRELTQEEKKCITERVRQLRSGRPINPSPMYDGLVKECTELVNDYKSTVKIQK